MSRQDHKNYDIALARLRQMQKEQEEGISSRDYILFFLAAFMALGLFLLAPKLGTHLTFVVLVLMFASLVHPLWRLSLRKGTSHPANQRARLALLLISACAGIGLLGYYVWPPTGISITPSYVRFDPTESHQNYIFTAKNNSEDILYADEFKWRADSPSLSASDFEIHVPVSSLKPIIDGSPSSDICGMFLRDKQNRLVLLVQVFRMTPHEMREISITHVKTGPATLYAMPSVFKAEPQPRIGVPEDRSCTFYADEILKIESDFLILMNGSVVDVTPKK